MDEEIILKFKNREGEALNYYDVDGESEQKVKKLELDPVCVILLLPSRGFLLEGRYVQGSKKRLKIAAKVAEQSGHGHVSTWSSFDQRRFSAERLSKQRQSYIISGKGFALRPGEQHHHADSCVLGVNRTATTHGATMYVARVNKTGEWRMSKPCSMCHEVMKFVGIKK